MITTTAMKALPDWRIKQSGTNYAKLLMMIRDAKCIMAQPTVDPFSSLTSARKTYSLKVSNLRLNEERAAWRDNAAVQCCSCGTEKPT